MQDYHNIKVWRRAHALAINVRRATQRMPRSGYSDLKSQMTSAAEELAYGHRVLPDRMWRYLCAEVIEVRKMLCGYRGSVLRGEARERTRKGERRNEPGPGG